MEVGGDEIRGVVKLVPVGYGMVATELSVLTERGIVKVLPQAATHVKDFKSLALEHLRKIAAGEEVDEPFALTYRDVDNYTCVRLDRLSHYM